ncbi:helix-turn-helix domain-containing protein [Pseudomonas sp. LMG 31766]|nr:helix-turn-helix transcriptional regulator [Pseudomonas mendocina]MBZ9665231.1 helix-turn-helix domain-containing protein [Pseudomonas chaetocerotis]
MIRERLIDVWDRKKLSAPKLEKLTGIDRSSWYHLRNGKRRANEQDIEAIVQMFPQYAFWIASGQIAPEIGQTSPDYDEANRNLSQPNAG